MRLEISTQCTYLVPRTSLKGRPNVTSSLLKLYALAKYLDASSAISATLVMFFAMTLILAEADMNHSGDLGTCPENIMVGFNTILSRLFCLRSKVHGSLLLIYLSST